MAKGEDSPADASVDCEPWPIATETSAAAKATESLIPSEFGSMRVPNHSE